MINIVEGYVNLVRHELGIASMDTEVMALVRGSMCATCPEYVNGDCKKCGCLVKAKIRAVGSRCPLNRW